MGIFPFLRHHLFLLNRADSVLRVKDDDPGSRNIGKSCHRGFSGISGGRSEDYNLIFCIVLSGSRRQKVRQNGKSHILERNRRAMEQFQKINSFHFCQGSNCFCVELFIICSGDTVFQFFLCKVCKETAHNFIRHFLIAHLRQSFHRNIQGWNPVRHKQPSVLCQAFQDRL